MPHPPPRLPGHPTFRLACATLDRGFKHQGVVGWVLMVGALFVAAAFIFWLQRGLTFIWDEFIWMENAGLGGVRFYVHPYVGHLIAFPYVVYRVVLELFGTSYVAYSVIQVAGLSAAAALVYVYAKRRLGPILALTPAITLLALGSSWQVLLQPMVGIQFLAAVVPGLAAVLLLERNERRSDIAACALLCLSATGFDQVLPFLAGAFVIIALGPNWRRRIWVAAVPTLGFVAWHVWALRYEPAAGHLSNIPLLPTYFVDSLAALSNSLVGTDVLVAPGPWSLLRLERSDINIISEAAVFAVLELLAICGAIWVMRMRRGISRTFWPALAMLVTLMAELGVVFAPGRTAFENRYYYTGALLLLLLLVEFFKGVRTTRVTVAVAFALTFVAVFGNIPQFREGRQSLDAYQKQARAVMTVVQLAGRHGDQSFSPNIDAPEFTPEGLWTVTGPWREVVDRYGSVADSIPQLQGQDELVRERADIVAAAALELRLAAAAATGHGRCRRVGAPGIPLEVALPRGGAILMPKRTSEVAVRRWGDDFAAGLGAVQGGRAALLRIPSDPAASIPWRLRLAQGGPLAVCSLS